MRFRVFGFLIALAGVVTGNAQWLDYPTRKTPLTREGRPNLAAKTPRVRGGKPDLSGVWQIEPPQPGEIERIFGGLVMKQAEGDDPRMFSKYFHNLFVDFKEGESPIRPEAAAVALKRPARDFVRDIDDINRACGARSLRSRFRGGLLVRILAFAERIFVDGGSRSRSIAHVAVIRRPAIPGARGGLCRTCHFFVQFRRARSIAARDRRAQANLSPCVTAAQKQWIASNGAAASGAA